VWGLRPGFSLRQFKAPKWQPWTSTPVFKALSFACNFYRNLLWIIL
jgi:hypothetical protein